jgi:hypothetical protein
MQKKKKKKILEIKITKKIDHEINSQLVAENKKQDFIFTPLVSRKKVEIFAEF